ncbi:hypothetical protein EPUL_003114, partial [Erysiphe pulchra]
MMRHEGNPPVIQNNDPHSQPVTAQKSPMAAPKNFLAHNMHQSIYQKPHSSNLQNSHPSFKITPPQEDPWIIGARCRMTYHDKNDIIFARNEGCNNMPFYHDNNIATKKADQYFPENPETYEGSPPFYLFPVGKPIVKSKNVRYYGFDRVVLDQQCQVVGVLIEWPKLSEITKNTLNFIRGRPIQAYDQSRYKYEDCLLFVKPLKKGKT